MFELDNLLKDLAQSGTPATGNLAIPTATNPASLFAQALEGHDWLILEVTEPDYRASQMLTRENVERLAAWAAGRRWRLLDPATPDDEPPKLLLEG
ncbi:hypothetical protein [Meiothermus cerbereus]|uniref:hypothetical protein n=1 Tax=Meiothermus cerbereus TaxID=65552 RepID=UPI003EEBC5F8